MLRLPETPSEYIIDDQTERCCSITEFGIGITNCEDWVSLDLDVCESSFPPLPIMPINSITASYYGFIGLQSSAGFADACCDESFKGGKLSDPS